MDCLLLVLSMDDSDCHIRHLFDSPIESITMRAVSDLFALSDQCSKDESPLLRVGPHFVLVDDLESFSLIDHDSAACFANALQDIDCLLEVTNMEHRQLEGDISEMAGTAFKRLEASVTVLSLVGDTLKDIKSLISTILRSSGPPLQGIAGLSML